MQPQSDPKETSYSNLIFAQSYDFIISKLTERKNIDVELIGRIAEEFGDSILEVGCGTGGILIPLLQKGFSAVGLDNSQEMLNVFKDKLNYDYPELKSNVKLILGDMIDRAHLGVGGGGRRRGTTPV